jgi:hypothetical protein
MIDFIKKHKFIIFIIIIFLLFFLTTIKEDFVNQISNNEIKNAIVIVEPRPHKLLESVIRNFDSIIPITWDLYVFHGKSHYNFAYDATKNILQRNKILIQLDTDNLDANSYNKLLKQESFWNKVNAEHILVFQTDSVLCKNSKYKIEDFMKYNYIGCPFNGTYIGKDENGTWSGKHYFYGIGGLSYRKKSFMINCIRNYPIEDNFPEDVFYSNCVAETSDKPENALVLNKFCTQFSGLDSSFGVHKPESLVNKQEFSNYCPEMNMLIT